MAPKWFVEQSPVIIMIIVQLIFGGSTVVNKLLLEDDMSMPIVVFYRLLFGAASLAPIAYFLERGRRPNLNITIIFYSFISGFFGGPLFQNLYLASINYTSATFGAAIYNLTPTVTYLVAVCFSLELFSLTTLNGIVKVGGTIVSLGGAMLFTFYKGFEIKLWHTHINLLHHPLHDQVVKNHQQAIGLSLALLSCVTYSFYIISAAKLSEIYPCPLSSSVLVSIFGSIQAGIYAVSADRNWGNWKLGLNLQLYCLLYLGVLASGLNFTLMSWALERKGPLFVSIFIPFMLPVTAVASSIFLNEKLHLGSVLGGIIIISGLYMVIWAKSKDPKRKDPTNQSISEEEGSREISIVVH